MRLKILWDGNPDGSCRSLDLDGSRRYLWVFVERADGSAWHGNCAVTATARSTSLASLWNKTEPVRSRWRGKPAASASLRKHQRTRAAPADEVPESVKQGQGEPVFSVGPLPKRWLPYCLEVEVHNRASEPDESAVVHVVPHASRRISLVFVVLTLVLAAYFFWFFLTVGSGGAMNAAEKIASQVFTLIGPVITVAVPMYSRTVRRELTNCLSTGIVFLAVIVATGWLTTRQRYVALVNATPAKLDLSGDGGEITLEPGTAVVIAAQDDALRYDVRQRLESEPDPGEANRTDQKKGGDFLAVGNYCLKRARGTVQQGTGEGGGRITNDAGNRSGAETQANGENVGNDGNGGHGGVAASGAAVQPDECLEFRPPNWYARLQRSLAVGDTFVVGCQGRGNLEQDYKERWVRSGSCKADPELEVNRALEVHLEHHEVRKLPKLEPKKCSGLRGSIWLRPFRQASQSRDPPGSDLLRVSEVFWPGSDYHSNGELPVWTFAGDGEVDRVRVVPGLTDDCKAAYGSPCVPEQDHCSTMVTPAGALSVTLERGQQTLGKLWCESKAGTRVFAARASGRIAGFKVVNAENRTIVLSTYDSALPSLNNWVLWCEPLPTTGQVNDDFRAELILSDDFQPDLEWKLVLPEKSALKTVVVFQTGAGRWGTVERRLKGQNLRLQKANPQDTGVDDAESAEFRWERYSEASAYPLWFWVWTDKRHDVRAGLSDGRTAKVTANGVVSVSPGAPCLIHRVTGERIGSVDFWNISHEERDVRSATRTVHAFKTAGCDPSRSLFPSRKPPPG